MESQTHSLDTLFKQLGLNSTDAAIDEFVNQHKPLPAHVELHDADFWNDAQATFLKQIKDEDADWAEIADQLDVMLR